VANDLGINHWEPLFGLVPWIRRCQKRGELLELEGEKLDFDNPQTWLTLLQNVAYRRSWGDLLAEGGRVWPERWGVGEDLIEQNYPAWGQASHWDGHGTFTSPYFPYWLVTALQWAMDTRDPMGGGHGYTTNIFGLMRAVKPGDVESLRKLLNVGEQIYGCSDAVDPRGGYCCKAAPAIFHHDRATIKDSLGICDNIFPLLTSHKEDDWLIRVDGGGWGVPRHYLFQATTDGISRAKISMPSAHGSLRQNGCSPSQLGPFSEYRRDDHGLPELSRRHDEPWLSEPVTVDGARFRALLDEYYDLRGWDRNTAHPYRETLSVLGMEEYIPAETKTASLVAENSPHAARTPLYWHKNRRKATMHMYDLDTPALVLNLDVLEQNIRNMAAHCAQLGIPCAPTPDAQDAADCADATGRGSPRNRMPKAGRRRGDGQGGDP